MLEHLDDPVCALKGFADRIRPAGRVIATTPNLHPRIPWWDPVAADPTHINVHDPTWWRGAVEQAGLVPRRITTFVTVPLLWRVLGPAGCQWLPLGAEFGPGILISAERPTTQPDTAGRH